MLFVLEFKWLIDMRRVDALTWCLHTNAIRKAWLLQGPAFEVQLSTDHRIYVLDCRLMSEALQFMAAAQPWRSVNQRLHQ